MRLLVSVSNGAEAAAALAGGADIIDAKDPFGGALGAVSLETLRDITATVAGGRLVTAAIGDAWGKEASEIEIERTARAFAVNGAAFAKIGFAGTMSTDRVRDLITAAVRGAGRCVVAVAYADADRVSSIAPDSLVEVAAEAGATGVLLDTADKTGPGLVDLLTPEALAAWVAAAHDARLLVALAGKLTAGDLMVVRKAGADIAGVRGAACEGGRTGRVSSERVALLRAICSPAKAGHHVRHDAVSDVCDGVPNVRSVQL
jgi:(5-formylfuran-3-yl)methyl phosphate synthase